MLECVDVIHLTVYSSSIGRVVESFARSVYLSNPCQDAV